VSASGVTRQPERSRKAILDAAEQVFARHGFDGASLAEIGRVAEVSAALPAYFFGDKRSLYDRVIERLFEERDAQLERVCKAAALALERDGLRRGLEVLVGGYLRFLQLRPTFVTLMSREALEIPRRATRRRHSPALERGLAEFVRSIVPPGRPAPDAGQLLVSLVALCWFPLEHDATMLAGMGYDTFSDEFIAARTEHVVDLLVRALEG